MADFVSTNNFGLLFTTGLNLNLDRTVENGETKTRAVPVVKAIPATSIPTEITECLNILKSADSGLREKDYGYFTCLQKVNDYEKATGKQYYFEHTATRQAVTNASTPKASSEATELKFSPLVSVVSTAETMAKALATKQEQEVTPTVTTTTVSSGWKKYLFSVKGALTLLAAGGVSVMAYRLIKRKKATGG